MQAVVAEEEGAETPWRGWRWAVVRLRGKMGPCHPEGSYESEFGPERPVSYSATAVREKKLVTHYWKLEHMKCVA